MNLNLSKGFNIGRNVIVSNSPELLVGTAIVGVITTGVTAARAGYKARGIVDEATVEKGEALTTQEKVQLTWLCYAVPAVTGASTIAACVGMHTIHTKRANAMAALYAVTSNKLDDYSEKAEELLGPKKTQALNNDVAQSSVDRNPLGNSSEVIITPGGTELMQDEWSGRYFRGSVNQVEAIVNDLNRKLIEEEEVPLNDFYDLLKLPEVEMGHTFGWSGSDKINVRFGGALTPDGEPVVTVWFHTKPKTNLGRR